MDKLKQFDKSFGLSFTKQEVETMFVNNIEASVYTKLRKDEAGITYYSFIDKFSFRIGLKISDFRKVHSYELLCLSAHSKGDFIQTMRFIIVTYEIMQETRFAAYIDETIRDIIANLPAPLGVRWFEGNFYKDDFPEITQELFSENLAWLSEFPAAKTDMEIALKHYSSGDRNGIIENIYKALENITQQITGSPKALHDPELAKKLFSILNVSENWRQFLAKFVTYANDYARHGKKKDRHSADADEIESFLFLALIILRMISKREKRQRILPIDRHSLFHYLTNSALVRRIENEIISINPRLRILKDHTEYNPITAYLLENIRKMGLKSIGDIEELYLKYEKNFILEEQIELKDSDVDYYGQGASIVALTNFVLKNN